MKGLLNITRVFVGVLFIFSGLIKANDPLGLSYKMQEFFEIWHMEWLNNFTLSFSVLMIVFEIVAGVAVILGWRMKLFSWLLLLLILFFTFLTGYAFLSGKVRECGCFGNCIPLTAGESFSKDILLLILILFIFINRKRIQPWTAPAVSISILGLATVFSFALQWFVLQQLPVIDCLPYKKGADIVEKMKVPPGAIPDSTVITFVYDKDGKQVEFTADKFPADFGDNYKLIKRYDKLIRKGNAEAEIKDFVLKTVSGIDSTQEVLQQKGYKILLFAKELPVTNPSWNKEFSLILAIAKSKQVPVYLATANTDEATNYVEKNNLQNQMQVFGCDVVAIKTAARANPTLYLLKNSVILDKWSGADFENAIPAMGPLPVQQTGLQ